MNASVVWHSCGPKLFTSSFNFEKGLSFMHTRWFADIIKEGTFISYWEVGIGTKVTDIQKFTVVTLVYRSRDAPALLSMRFHVHLCIRKANLILRFVFLGLCVFACHSSKNSDALSLTFPMKLKFVFVCFMHFMAIYWTSRRIICVSSSLKVPYGRVW